MADAFKLGQNPVNKVLFLIGFFPRPKRANKRLPSMTDQRIKFSPNSNALPVFVCVQIWAKIGSFVFTREEPPFSLYISDYAQS